MTAGRTESYDSAEPGWRTASGPYLRPAAPAAHLAWQTSAAALPMMAAGAALFGLRSAGIVALCGAASVVANHLLAMVSSHGRAMSAGHAMMTGVLLGLTLPPTAGWELPLIGALIAMSAGKWLLGGAGHQLWSPVLIGRVVLQLVSPRAMLAHAGPVLASGRLFFGDLSGAVNPALYPGWRRAGLPNGADSWMLARTDTLLSSAFGGMIHSGPAEAVGQRVGSLGHLIRDFLPPWEDTVLGLGAGGVGETCVACILIGGLYLTYRGLIRWQLPAAILAAAAITAAVFPIAAAWNQAGDVIARNWLPVLTIEGGAPVGLVYVLYHLTAGELMFAAFFIATDMVTSPMRARGQIIFGLCIGVLTICLRMVGVIPGSAYWAILIMNPLVPLIDRLTRRRVFGL